MLAPQIFLAHYATEPSRPKACFCLFFIFHSSLKTTMPESRLFQTFSDLTVDGMLSWLTSLLDTLFTCLLARNFIRAWSLTCNLDTLYDMDINMDINMDLFVVLPERWCYLHVVGPLCGANCDLGKETGSRFNATISIPFTFIEVSYISVINVGLCVGGRACVYAYNYVHGQC